MWRSALAVALAWPVVAYAAGGGGSGLSTVVVLVLGISVAYLLTHFVVGRIEERFLVVTGLEFLVLGGLLGPTVAAYGTHSGVLALAPFLALAAGWVGLVSGTHVDLRGFGREGDQALRIGLLDAAIPGLLVAVVARQAWVAGWLGEGAQSGWLTAGVLGCAAAAGSSSAIDLVSRRYKLTGGLSELLARAAKVGDVVAIGVFGLLFCVFHARSTGHLGASDWVLVTVGLGVALGLLFSLFVGRADSDNERFVALVGIILFAAGAAFLLDLSVLLVNLVLGVVLANTARAVDGIRGTLARSSRPLSLVLLVFAGVLWKPVPWLPALTLIAGYLALRFAGKALAGWLASLGTGLRPDLTRGLFAQGDVAVAIAVSYRLVYSGPEVDLAYTAILGAAIVHELIAPRWFRALLVDAGELHDDARANGATP